MNENLDLNDKHWDLNKLMQYKLFLTTESTRLKKLCETVCVLRVKSRNEHKTHITTKIKRNC